MKERLHWVHNSSVRKAPATIPNVYSYWMTHYCRKHEQWEFRGCWLNPDVELEIFDVGDARLFIYLTSLGEIWTAITKSGLWILLNESEIQKAEEYLAQVES